MKITQRWVGIVLVLGCFSFSSAWAQETATSTTTSNNLGFQVDSIEDVDGNISFSDQFEAGLSTISETHKVNYAECAAYNNETSLATVEGALDSEGDARDSEDATDEEDVTDDSTEPEEDANSTEEDAEATATDEDATATDEDATVGAEDAETDGESEETDAEIAGDSCAGYCGGYSADESCFCDGDCEIFGDCCSDFCEACPDLGSCAEEGGEEGTTEEGTTEEGTTEEEGGETETSACDLGASSPTVEVSFSVDSSLSDYGYRWTAKIGSCGSGDLTASSDSCLLLTDSAQSLSSSGNTFEVSLAKLIGTMDEADDIDVTERNCCADREGYSGSTNVYVYVGSDSAGATDIEYDIVSFEFDYLAPSAPSGTSAEVLGETVSVSWDASSGESEDTTYTVYYSTESFDSIEGIASESAGTDRSATLVDLTLGTEYFFRVGAVDDFGNVSELSEEVAATPKETYDGWESYKQAGGTEEGGCFIATAAFGSYVAPHVQTLRLFRDQVLMTSEAGRTFVTWYYRVGPEWAQWLEQHEWAKAFVRVGLMPLVWVAGMMVAPGFVSHGLPVVLAMLLMAMVLVARTRKRDAVAVSAGEEN